MSTSAPPEQIFRPERHLEHLLVFRPLEYLKEWDDGFGKLKPAVITEWAVLSRGAAEKGNAGELVMVPVAEPVVNLATVRHIYLVQALQDAAGQGVLAGYLLMAGSAYVLMPPELSEYGQVYQQCRALSWC